MSDKPADPPHHPMLYSAASLRAVEDLRDGFGRELKRRAIEMARGDGRDTVDEADVLEAFKGMGLAGGADE